MIIAIDINDVIRDFSRNYGKYYKLYYNHEFEISDDEVWTNQLNILYPFKSDRAYEEFTYEKYVYELYGKCPTCYGQLTSDMNVWINHTIKNLSENDDIDVIIVSTMEYGLSIASTQFFISKLGLPVREYYFPKDSLTIWDRCDCLITANPRLLENKPEGKTSVKIEMPYNMETMSDFSFKSIKNIFKDENNTKKIILTNE